MRFLFFVFLISLLPSATEGQQNLSKHVVPIHDGPESTGLSIYNTNPESPDGRFLAFLKYKQIVQGGHAGPPTEAYLMIRERATGKTRLLDTVWVTNHNGANAIWINDSLIACQIGHVEDFEVFHAGTGASVSGRIRGELGHKAVHNTIYFSRSNERMRDRHPDRLPFRVSEEGIWRYEVLTGKVEQVVPLSEIIQAFQQQNPNINGAGAQLLHVDPNATGERILFDYRHFRQKADKRRKQLQGYVNADGTGLRWVPTRPMHVIWFDDTTMMGVDMEDPEKKIYRYDLYGQQLELLAGKACHLGISPDQKWIAGEFGFYRAEPDGYTRLYLYANGEPEPRGIIDQWTNEKITWWWVAHVNPSFSADGQRLYFIRAVDGEEKFEAAVLDLTAAEIITKKK